MTPEQKFLKAIAEHFNQRSNPPYPFSIVMAAVGYLSEIDIIEDGKKVEFHGCDHTMPDPITGELPMGKVKFGDSLTWKPEVGKLYKRTLNGVVTEITKLKSDRVLHILQRFDYDPDIENGYHEDYIIDFIKEYEPIAELEGLKEGDKAWCISGSGEAEYYTIESVFSNNLTAHCGKGYLSIYLDGSACMFGGGKQIFWRTADRADRFGRGDA